VAHLVTTVSARTRDTLSTRRPPAAEIKPPSDDLLAQLAQTQDLAFSALGARSHLVQYSQEMSSHFTGLTTRAFLPSILAAADVLLGPVQVEAVTECNQHGAARNVARNVSAAFTCNVAPCARPPHTTRSVA